MRPIIWSAFILALATLPMAAQPRLGRDLRTERIARALNLTDAQRVSIQGIREKHRPDLVLRRDAVRQAQAALRTALRDPATPEPQLRTLHDRASAAQFEVILARRSVRQDVQAVLTPEQRTKAVEMRGVAQGKARERMRHSRMATGLAG